MFEDRELQTTDGVCSETGKVREVFYSLRHFGAQNEIENNE